jgi:hypothetical protein
MTGPDDDFRGGVADIARELTSKAALEGLLGEIDQAVQADVERGPGESVDDDLAAIESRIRSD